MQVVKDIMNWLKKIDSAFSRLSFIFIFLIRHIPIKHRKSTNEILIVRPGGMGDLICLCIAMENMNINTHSFLFLIETRSEPWARYLKLRYLCYDRLSIPRVFSLLHKFKTVINTEQYFGLSQIFSFWCTQPGGDLYTFNTNRVQSPEFHRVVYNPHDEHEVSSFTRLLCTGLNIVNTNQEKFIHRLPNKTQKHYVLALAGGLSPSRQLSLESWRFLIHHFFEDKEFFITAGPTDTHLLNKIAEVFPKQAKVLQSSFSDFCQIIRDTKRLLTIDGGPVHIASYFGVETIAVFTSSIPKKWAPLGVTSKWIQTKNTPCQPCALFAQVPTCFNHYACTKINNDTWELKELNKLD